MGSRNLVIQGWLVTKLICHAKTKSQTKLRQKCIHCHGFKETKPLVGQNIQMKSSDKEKWLGQQLPASDLSDSVLATVQAREGKIHGVCLEISHTRRYRGLWPPTSKAP